MGLGGEAEDAEDLPELALSNDVADLVVPMEVLEGIEGLCLHAA